MTHQHAILDQHFTPKYVCDFMVSLAPEVQCVLEPSAGSGNLANSLVSFGFTPDVIEMDPYYAKMLEDQGHSVVGSNFLMFKSELPYDLIVMNPPYTGGSDSIHVEHALKLADEVIALTRINIFASKERYSKIWKHCNLLGFYPLVSRPKFSESKGTMRHDVCVIHLQSLYHTNDEQEPPDFKVISFE